MPVNIGAMTARPGSHPYRLSDFDFELPQELIAQSPISNRSQSRLLVVEKNRLVDRTFIDLIDLLTPKDLLVFNNSKVIPARLRAHKASGAAVEILIERIRSTELASAMIRANRKPKPGERLLIDAAKGRFPDEPSSSVPGDGHSGAPDPIDSVEFIGRDPEHDDRFLLKSTQPWLSLLEDFGELPLPPYIDHSPNEVDAERYQTVYAAHPGSVAAPTAGLHFDESMLEKLRAKGVGLAHVTLHVGSGTFAPVREEDISKHQMHAEWCEVSKTTTEAIARTRAQGGRVVAVGTTSLRTLESAVRRALETGDSAVESTVKSALESSTPSWLADKLLAGQWETDIFITPGYEFKLVDALVTNFHLPKSTLLMLVSAFAGFDTIRGAYAHAVAERYRFFSYGDAMFLERC
jgi:S-adenosylmethionine:tRNA ribosyltransferase-isomerase